MFLRALWARAHLVLYLSSWFEEDFALSFCLLPSRYADDIQLCVSFKPNQSDAVGAIRNLEACIKDVAVWMNSHSLKLNKEKTEFVLFGSKVNLSKIDINSIVIPDTVIGFGVSDSCRNLGVINYARLHNDHVLSNIQHM